MSRAEVLGRSRLPLPGAPARTPEGGAGPRGDDHGDDDDDDEITAEIFFYHFESTGLVLAWNSIIRGGHRGQGTAEAGQPNA